MIAVIATLAGVLLAAWIYWPLYRDAEIRRLTDATMARYARRYGR